LRQQCWITEFVKFVWEIEQEVPVVIIYLSALTFSQAAKHKNDKKYVLDIPQNRIKKYTKFSSCAKICVAILTLVSVDGHTVCYHLQFTQIPPCV